MFQPSLSLLILFCFFVKSMLSAESAILVHFQSVRIVFLVLHSIVVALLTFRTSQSDFYSHALHLRLVFIGFISDSIFLDTQKKRSYTSTVLDYNTNFRSCQHFLYYFFLFSEQSYGINQTALIIHYYKQ